MNYNFVENNVLKKSLWSTTSFPIEKGHYKKLAKWELKCPLCELPKVSFPFLKNPSTIRFDKIKIKMNENYDQSISFEMEKFSKLLKKFCYVQPRDVHLF